MRQGRVPLRRHRLLVSMSRFTAFSFGTVTAQHQFPLVLREALDKRQTREQTVGRMASLMTSRTSISVVVAGIDPTQTSGIAVRLTALSL